MLKKARIILFLIFLGCSGKTEKIKLENVILCAEPIPFDSLTQEQQSKVGQVLYYPEKNWDVRKEMDKEDAYFVKTVINNQLLAELSKSGLFPVEKLLAPDPYILYGFYANSWKFFGNEDNKIFPTSKLNGHEILEINRVDSLDYLIVGPLPGKPQKMEIKIRAPGYDYPNGPERIVRDNCR